VLDQPAHFHNFGGPSPIGWTQTKEINLSFNFRHNSGGQGVGT